MSEPEQVVKEPESRTPTSVSSMFLAPSLRLSKRQRSILGMGGAPLPPTEKQKLRNIEAGKRLRAYHQHRKEQREATSIQTKAAIEKDANVTIVSPKKRVALKKKRDPSPVESSDSDSEVIQRVKKASKTAKAIEKLDARIAKVVAPVNPYYELMMKF